MIKHGVIIVTAALLMLVFGGAGYLRAQVAEDVEARRARLQAELEAEERAIAEQTKLLEAKQRDTATVQGEIDLLKAQIKRAETNIKAKRVQITRLEDDIKNREGKILTLDQKIRREQGSLSELLRKTRDLDATSFVEILLGNEQFSDFFNDVDDFTFVQKSIHQAFAEMRGAQEEARREKVALEERKNREIDAQKVIEEEQRLIASKEKDKQVILSANKSQEAVYKQVLAERQRRAAQIRAALFALRDTAAIPFGKALEYATAASKKTGVRPALILAILEQESNLGANVGSCVITNLQSGETRSMNSGRVFANGIHPTRDLPLLQSILPALGRNPLDTPVSCPLSIGYGGAMGPAQFIPSTWNLMSASIAAAVGVGTPDPWNPEHAFMAAAMLLRDNGAAAGGYTAEVNAACRYYSGRTCAAGPGSSYGNQVMGKASNIQLNMINPLQNI